MKTCFVCAQPAHWAEVWFGRPVCERCPCDGPKIWTPSEDERLRQIVNWHSNSAYARERAMAKRLQGVVR